jgi:hypothetical protein
VAARWARGAASSAMSAGTAPAGRPTAAATAGASSGAAATPACQGLPDISHHIIASPLSQYTVGENH